MLKRRRSNVIFCHGKCGDKTCNFKAEYKNKVKEHFNKKKRLHKCLVVSCKYHTKGLCRRKDLIVHIRNQHPELASMFPQKKRLGLPKRFVKHRSDFYFIKKMVRNCTSHDLLNKKRWEGEHVDYLCTLNDESFHIITAAIVDYLIAKQAFSAPFTDCTGGYIENGLIFRTHGGLFKASLDRKNNKLPHFLPSIPVMSNLNVIPLALNDATEPVNTHGSNLVAVLRTKQREYVSQSTIKARIEYESKKYRYIKDTYTGMTLYVCCKSIWTNKKYKFCRGDFKDLAEFHTYALGLLKRQKCKCAVSDILMLGARHTYTKKRMYKLSIDAIDATKGHVRGNMQIVCQFLNPTCRDKDKTHHDPTDGPSRWTQILFNTWLWGPTWVQ